MTKDQHAGVGQYIKTAGFSLLLVSTHKLVDLHPINFTLVFLHFEFFAEILQLEMNTGVLMVKCDYWVKCDHFVAKQLYDQHTFLTLP